jgi:hypothetical protein
MDATEDLLMRPYICLQADLTTVFPRGSEASTRLLARKIDELRENRHYHDPEATRGIPRTRVETTLHQAEQVGAVSSRMGEDGTLLWTLLGDDLYLPVNEPKITYA